jgi:MFS family permease
MVERTDGYRWLDFGVLGSAYFLILMDGTIVYVALPQIQREFDLAIAGLPWVMTAYLLGFGGLVLVGDRLWALIGPQRLFTLGLGLMTAASLMCGLAGSPGVLVAGRAVQGIGAAMVAPATLPLLAMTVRDGPERRLALQLWTVIGAAAGTVGLLIGGPLTDGFGWRWVFLLNVPVGLVLVVGSALLPQSPVPAPPERLGSLSSRPRRVGVAVLVAVGVAVDGTSFLLTMYTQRVLDLPATGFGVTMTALTLSAVAGSAVGQITVLRPGLRTTALAGLGLVAAGCLVLARLPVPGDAGHVVSGLLVLGPGVGAAFAAGQIAVVANAPQAASLRLAGITDASFSLGGALGLVLLSVVLASGDADIGTDVRTGFAVTCGVAALGVVSALALPRRPRSDIHKGQH